MLPLYKKKLKKKNSEKGKKLIILYIINLSIKNYLFFTGYFIVYYIYK